MMINLPYSLIIEATGDPNFFGFYSPDLPGFSGVGHFIEDCIYQALHGMDEHLEVMAEEGLTPPPQNKNNEIIIRNAVGAAS